MTVENLLTLITQIALVLIAFLKFVEFLRHRDQTRFDILLMFGALALIVLTQWLAPAIESSANWLSLLDSVLLVAHPYLLLRLIHHLRPVSNRMRGFALGGMILSWIFIVAMPPPRPILITLFIVVYFIYFEVFSALAMFRGAAATSGVTHWRLLLAAGGSGLLAVVILIAGINAVFPAAADFFGPLSQLVALAAILSYYFGFAPPNWLRRYWQSAELHRFLNESTGQWMGVPMVETLQRLCMAGVRSADGYLAVVTQWDERENRMAVRASSAPEKVPVSSRLDHELIKRTWHQRQARLVELPANFTPGEASMESAAGDARAVLVVPIETQERAWGLLLVFLLRIPLFASDDLALLSLLSEQTAIILGYGQLLSEQQTLIEQLRRNNQRLEALNEIERAILAARSPEKIASAALSRLRQLVPCQRASVVLFDFENKQAHVVAADAEDNIGAPAGATLGLEEFSSIEALQANQSPVYFEDLSLIEDRPVIVERLWEQGIRSMLIAPLISEKKLIGELALSSVEAAIFQTEHQNIAREVADQLAITIQQARLREELQHYAAELEQRVADRTAQLETAVQDLQTEITARQRANEALHRAQQRLQFLLSATPAIIYSARAGGDYGTTFVSENVSAQLGYDALEFLKEADFWFNHIHAEDAPAIFADLSRFEEHGHQAREYRFLHKDGKYRWIRDEFRLVYDAEGKPLELVGYWIDITERKQAEEAIRKLNEELQQHAIELRAANQELEAFAYSVSHDLRAPLRAIDGFSRILLTHHAPELADEARRYLQLVRNNTQEMGQLIDDLLAFSRLSRQSIRKQIVEPAGLVRLVMNDLLKEQDGRNIELVIGYLPRCEVDFSLIKQVFVNLLSNALKFTSKRETACIEIGCQSLNGEQVYYVKDNGVGFDMQYADKLFGVFQRLHRTDEFEGTGVGLAIVQRIIHRHGGRIWVEAEVDQGATFYFTLQGAAES